MTASTLSLWSLHVLLPCLCCRCSVPSAIVNTTYGPVKGSVISLSTNKTVITYLGIPFAKAERFEYPVPPDKWTSTLHANKTDKICPQPSLPGQPSRLSLMSEDCLLLNVYVPGNATNTTGGPNSRCERRWNVIYITYVTCQCRVTGDRWKYKRLCMRNIIITEICEC